MCLADEYISSARLIMSDWCIHKNCTEMLPCILSLLRPPAGRELWDTGTRALHVLVTSLAPMTVGRGN